MSPARHHDRPGRAAPSLLIVTTVPGTIASFLLPYADHLRAQGWRVDAATSPGSETAELVGRFDRLWPVRWSRRTLDPRNLTLGLLALRRVLRRGRFDLVHTHTPVASLVTRLAVATLRPSRRPAVVYTAHGFHFGVSDREGPAERLFAVLERLGGRWTDRLVVINADDFDSARRRRLVSPDRLRHLPGIGVDLDWYRPTEAVADGAAQLRHHLGLSAGDALFSMLAYFDPGKNHQLVLRALSHLNRADIHVAFAGRGPLEARLREEAARWGVASQVHFLGVVGDVRPLVAASVATLLPSYREGLSRAVLESLAMGVPVVGSRIRGITELVEPDGGLLVDPDDAGALAAAMEKILEDVGACFDGAAVARRLEAYGIGPLLHAHDDLYNELLPQRRPERTPDR